MRVLLAGPDNEENLSIRYLSAALLNAGHTTVLAPFNSSSDVERVAHAACQADLIGLSMCFQARAQEFLQLARMIKANDPGRFIVAGGHYASCAAEPLLSHHPELDVIVIGEGERTMVEIADTFPQDARTLPHISGIAYRNQRQICFTEARPMVDDLDMLAFPDRAGPIHFVAGVPTSYLMGSRGCYGHCAYCCITTLHRMTPGRRFRQRRVDCIADEMATLYHDRGTRQFVFHDDNFLVPARPMNHARISALEKALRSRGVHEIAIVIKCRPADLDRAVLQQLKDLGLVRVFLGVESSTELGLSSLEREQSVEESVRALETCADLNVSAQFTLMTFNPDATLSTVRADLAFMRRFSAHPLNFCRAEIYTGTPLEKRMIQLGRARGDYLGREYDLGDPVADLACKISLDMFHARCWKEGSLMQNAIGLDHMAAVLRHFYDGQAASELALRVGSWLRAVNLDTVSLLDEVVDLCESRGGSVDAGFRRALLALSQHEALTRRDFLDQAAAFRAEIQNFRLSRPVDESNRVPVSRSRVARQIATAVLAIGIPATSGPQALLAYGTQAQAAPTATQEKPGAILGTVTDASGAVVAQATITITNADSHTTRTLKTNATGQYEADDLPSGRYNILVQSPGFKGVEQQNIELKSGGREHADIKLSVTDFGCCEYAAVPLKSTNENLMLKKKPFTYTVGEQDDHHTFQGIAKLVYGNALAWVQIYEVNRDIVGKPGFIPTGTSILIPARDRALPRLLHRVMPVYPPSALKDHISGDVILVVTLSDDGTVRSVDVIDGNPLIADAATAAVKQWRYEAYPSKAKSAKRDFVVIVSFTKRGSVRVQ